MKKLSPQRATGKAQQKTELERGLGEETSRSLTVDRAGESRGQSWPECGAVVEHPVSWSQVGTALASALRLR